LSFDYFVAVHNHNWPTAAAMQAALVRLEYPLALGEAPQEPLSVAEWTFSLPVVFEGRPVVLEADIRQATDVGDAESLFGYLAQCAAPDFTILDGDYFLTLTFRSDADQVRAGLYLAAAMILAFDGYGFENQFETHGGADFAQVLLDEASDASAFEF
jgi:hypothetical protein